MDMISAVEHMAFVRDGVEASRDFPPVRLESSWGWVNVIFGEDARNVIINRQSRLSSSLGIASLSKSVAGPIPDVSDKYQLARP